MLIAPSQTYSRLFRPWDGVEEEKNKLRKIRSRSREVQNQDSTISTTTDEPLEKDELNERLAGKSDSLFKKPANQKTIEVNPYPEVQDYQLEAMLHHGRYPDMLSQADFAQSLGIPPSDPLLLESFAQGYAMELEYARIMHQESQSKLLNSRKQRPKKYRCPHCDVGFSNNGQLKGHIRIHTGERPFKCDDKTCGKTFTRNEELTRHRRIHSGLRPYPCPTCGKKFGRRDHLKKHTRTHIVQAERMMPMFVPLTAMGSYPYLYGY